MALLSFMAVAERLITALKRRAIDTGAEAMDTGAEAMDTGAEAMDTALQAADTRAAIDIFALIKRVVKNKTDR